MELCEFQASLVCRVSSRTARGLQRNPVSKKKKKKKKKKKDKSELLIEASNFAKLKYHVLELDQRFQ
jgi:hypothetical protein